MKKLIFSTLLLLSLSTTIFAQYTFSGIVVDTETGEPLIAANIMVVGTAVGINRSTQTDFDGKYSFEHSDSTALLEISYTGYSSIKIQSVAGKEEKIALSPSMILDEVVVTSSESKKIKRANKRNRRHQANQKMLAPSPSVQIRGYASGIATYSDKQPIHNTEDYSAIQENRFYEVQKEPLSTFSIDVDAASYSNLRRFINNGQKPPKDAVRIEEMVNYFNYQYPEPTGKHPFEVVTEISDCPWNSDHRLVHIGMQGKKISNDQLPSSNLVFLVDVSGSMSAPNKLPLLKSSLQLLVNQLRPTDRVAIVVYAGAAGVVLPATKGTNKQKIVEALTKLEAGGSTAGGAGIQLAYKIARENFIKEGNNRVILATDGDFNVGVSSDAEMVRLIEKERKSGVFLTVLGYGMGNYKDNKMQELANKGNGNHAYIDNINEAKKVLVNEFGGTLFTIAKDVKFQLEFNPTKVQGYRLIGYENRLLNAEDFNDDQKDAGELGAGHTVTALYEIIPVGVKSKYLATVDNLKYQQVKVKKAAKNSDELLTIKLRYKKPDGEKSQLLEKPVKDSQISLEKSSDNFRFSAAVAEFGLLLRDSEFKNKANYSQAIKLAKSGKGKDENGYRMELIQLMKTINMLDGNEMAEKE